LAWAGHQRVGVDLARSQHKRRSKIKSKIRKRIKIKSKIKIKIRTGPSPALNLAPTLGPALSEKTNFLRGGGWKRG
jgi:hypothetical protein